MGWNFGEALHLHNEQLLKAAVQRRCNFDEGDVRVIVLEGQPIHTQRQWYRIVDAKTGVIEAGYVDVADMLTRQPWPEPGDEFRRPRHDLQRATPAHTMTTAVVVGAGPNGLAAAIHLARQGVDVQVLEARDTIGGGARSGELTVPGVMHDHCSAFHPWAVGSPFWREIDPQRYGLTLRWPEIDCAHLLDEQHRRHAFISRSRRPSLRMGFDPDAVAVRSGRISLPGNRLRRSGSRSASAR